MASFNPIVQNAVDWYTAKQGMKVQPADDKTVTGKVTRKNGDGTLQVKWPSGESCPENPDELVAVNMSAQGAVTRIEMELGTDDDEALNLLDYYGPLIKRELGDRVYRDLYRRATQNG